MNLRLLFVRGLDLPFSTLVEKGLVRFSAETKGFLSYLGAQLKGTRSAVLAHAGERPERILAFSPCIAAISQDFPALNSFNNRSIAHTFDLLGSGPVKVERGLRAAGVEGHVYQESKSKGPNFAEDSTKRNSTASLETEKLISNADYKPIDWHIDFKSGFRWDSRMWWRGIPHAHRPGVDIKVPWELARMQHLVSFALEACKIKETDSVRAHILQEEARNQILDFIAHNAPLFGVNWRCAMDVAIRAANWVLAIDLFRSAGFEFDADFYSTFLASLEDHGRFVVRNFEKYPDFRANHYLANLCGLAFIAAALPKTNVNRAKWLDVSGRELVSEIDFQFHDDGSNFEGSTSYHRLSAEMVVFTIALLNGEQLRSGENFVLPLSCLRKIEKFDDFSIAITKPSGCVVQIGDSDSGRFFKLPIRFENANAQSGIPKENDLDHRDLANSVRALFNSSTRGLAAEMIHSLQGSRSLNVNSLALNSADPATSFAPKSNTENLLREFSKAKFRQEYFFSSIHPLQNLVKTEFQDFGVTIFKNENTFLSFRCGALGQHGRAGHDHDDQLSIELEIDRRPVVSDPGTYLYTALKERRNEYRSVSAHFTPQFNRETADLNAGLFYLRKVYPGERLLSTSHAVAGRCRRGEATVFRMILIEKFGVRVYDWCETEELVDLGKIKPLAYSLGYGRL